MSLKRTTDRLKYITATDDIKSLSGLDSTALTQLASKFEFATDISNQITEACHQWWRESMPSIAGGTSGGLVTIPNDLLERTVISILKGLSKLAEGDFIILPGGWTNNYSGHAVLFVIQRETGLRIC